MMSENIENITRPPGDNSHPSIREIETLSSHNPCPATTTTSNSEHDELLSISDLTTAAASPLQLPKQMHRHAAADFSKATALLPSPQQMQRSSTPTRANNTSPASRKLARSPGAHQPQLDDARSPSERARSDNDDVQGTPAPDSSNSSPTVHTNTEKMSLWAYRAWCRWVSHYPVAHPQATHCPLPNIENYTLEEFDTWLCEFIEQAVNDKMETYKFPTMYKLLVNLLRYTRNNCGRSDLNFMCRVTFPKFRRKLEELRERDRQFVSNVQNKACREGVIDSKDVSDYENEYFGASIKRRKVSPQAISRNDSIVIHRPFRPSSAVFDGRDRSHQIINCVHPIPTSTATSYAQYQNVYSYRPTGIRQRLLGPSRPVLVDKENVVAKEQTMHSGSADGMSLPSAHPSQRPASFHRYYAPPYLVPGVPGYLVPIYKTARQFKVSDKIFETNVERIETTANRHENTDVHTGVHASVNIGVDKHAIKDQGDVSDHKDKSITRRLLNDTKRFDNYEQILAMSRSANSQSFGEVTTPDTAASSTGSGNTNVKEEDSENTDRESSPASVNSSIHGGAGTEVSRVQSSEHGLSTDEKRSCNLPASLSSNQVNRVDDHRKDHPHMPTVQAACSARTKKRNDTIPVGIKGSSYHAAVVTVDGRTGRLEDQDPVAETSREGKFDDTREPDATMAVRVSCSGRVLMNATVSVPVTHNEGSIEIAIAVGERKLKLNI